MSWLLVRSVVVARRYASLVRVCAALASSGSVGTLPYSSCCAVSFRAARDELETPSERLC